MINYGDPPASDEIEVTLFGPGYGEAVAVHLGESAWLLVDSCIDPHTNRPASETYLDQIGVDVRGVRAIVASHWHDDHVRGISQLSNRYVQAEFFISAVFNNDEATSFLAAYSGVRSAKQSRGTKELSSVVSGRQTVIAALNRTIVLDSALNGRRVMVTALSPMHAAFARSVAHMAQFLPRKDQPINHVPELQPNLEAVALHIDLGNDAVLLGADLEEDKLCGWSAVVSDKWSRSRTPSTVYKVAHHGSVTGDCHAVWRTLLRSSPVACLTPFGRGKVRLPTDSDKQRVRQNTSRAYISSDASRRADMDSRLLKRLHDMCRTVTRVQSGFGAVRLRRQADAPEWSAELFGAATTL